MSYAFTDADDPRRKLGYVIEERTYALMRNASIAFFEQNSLNFASGITRPDIVIRSFGQPLLEAFMDITASDSRNHVLGKAGGGWFKNENVVWVNEILYKSFTVEKARLVVTAAKAAKGGMSQDEINTLIEKNKAEILASQEAALKEVEALEVSLAEQQAKYEEDPENNLDPITAYAIEQGFMTKDNKNSNAIYRAKVDLYHRGVGEDFLADFRPRKKVISETQKEVKAKEKAKREHERKQKRAEENSRNYRISLRRTSYKQKYTKGLTALSDLVSAGQKGKIPAKAKDIVKNYLLFEAANQDYQTKIVDIATQAEIKLFIQGITKDAKQIEEAKKDAEATFDVDMASLPEE